MTYDLIQLMKKQLAEKKDAEVEKVMRLLEQNTRFSEEYAEVMVECSVAAFELGDAGQTIKYFRKAQVKYLADRENLLAVTWMMASAQWYIEAEKPSAIKNWQACEKLLDER